MDPFVRRFIRSSVIWLGIGVTLGLSMVFWPMQAMAYRPAHMHANLLGFVSMMIFGVAYHVVPRFSGNRLFSPRLAGAHVWIANLGLALMVGGWIARLFWRVPGEFALQAGALVSAVGVAFFIINIWRTLGAVRRSPSPKRSLAS